MTVEAVTAPQYESIVETEASLALMMSRLNELLDAPALTEAAFVEVAAVLDNVSYVFLYLESNEVHVDYRVLLPWRKAFQADPDLDTRLLGKLRELRCEHLDAEASRQAYVRYLEAKWAEDGSGRPDPVAEELQTVARALLAEVQSEQGKLLDRLGVAGAARPAAAFYTLVSGTADAGTRQKLTRAWTVLRDRRLPELLGTVDAMVALRGRGAAALGHHSAAARTFERCGVTEEAAEAFLERYLVRALEDHDRLEREIRAALGPLARPTDHFGRHVRQLVAGQRTSLVPLDECLDFAFQVARRVFGLEVRRVGDARPHVTTVEVTSGGREVGRINFDLWDSTERPKSANQTLGVRNRTDWPGVVQLPVAYVSCRFQRAPDGGRRINFQNAHSLFHEFGHAVNHLLIRKRLPNQSGLEYLPLERLENLSMWFEKWVYHPDFDRSLSLTGQERAGLAVSRQVKRLEYRRTHVDRSVTAALDLAVHRRPGTGLAEAFAGLDERFAVSRFCGLGDFPGYFTWPMLQANPGAYFSYLWGAAESAERFAPFLADGAVPVGPADFSACFDHDAPSVEPGLDAVFGFYRQPERPTGGERA